MDRINECFLGCPLVVGADPRHLAHQGLIACEKNSQLLRTQPGTVYIWRKGAWSSYGW